MSPESFGSSESGYGYDEHGAMMDKNDYNVENPDMPTDEYEKNIRLAEQEEENETRDAFSGEYNRDPNQIKSSEEALLEARQLMSEMSQKLDEIEAIFKATKVTEQPNPLNLDQQTISDKAAGATNINESEIVNQGNSSGQVSYIDSKGVVHSSPEELLDTENGYK